MGAAEGLQTCACWQPPGQCCTCPVGRLPGPCWVPLTSQGWRSDVHVSPLPVALAMARKCSDFSAVLSEVVSALLDVSCALILPTIIWCHMLSLVSACRKQINLFSLPSTSLLFSPSCCGQYTLRLRVCLSPCALWEWRDKSSLCSQPCQVYRGSQGVLLLWKRLILKHWGYWWVNVSLN